MGLENVVVTEGLHVSGALFNFLSVLEEPAGPGNESANRTQEERSSLLIVVRDGNVLPNILEKGSVLKHVVM